MSTKFYCKICHDSGKNHSVYTNHNTRYRGEVVCPTLLQTECRYCRKKGHTPKFCPKLEEKKRVSSPSCTNTGKGISCQRFPKVQTTSMRSTKSNGHRKEKGTEKQNNRFHMCKRMNTDERCEDSDSDLDDIVLKIDENAPRWGYSDDEDDDE